MKYSDEDLKAAIKAAQKRIKQLQKLRESNSCWLCRHMTGACIICPASGRDSKDKPYWCTEYTSDIDAIIRKLYSFTLWANEGIKSNNS